MFTFEGARVLVTGAAGFIGSHLCQELLRRGSNVKGIDNLVCGNRQNIESLKGLPNFKFIEGSLSDEDCLDEAVGETDAIFHLAVTRPLNNDGFLRATDGYVNDVMATYSLLKCVSQAERCGKKIVFTSSGLVYGEPTIIPTPENYGPLIPASPYGASKLASEAFISTFCHASNVQAAICRLSNVEGSRKPYGVVYDFINRLKADNTKLTIMGDPEDRRSYIHVSDCVDALLFCLAHMEKRIDYWNVAPIDSISVNTLARIVIEEMRMADIPLVSNQRSASAIIKGRVKESRPSIEKILSQGWTPKYGSEEAIRLAASELISELCDPQLG
jgi:UDP-glucose 4-epimerase